MTETQDQNVPPPIDSPNQLCTRCAGEGRLWVDDTPQSGHWEDPCSLCRGKGTR